MNYKLSRHVAEQMQARNIPVQLLEMVLDHPQQLYEENGVSVYQSRVERSGKTQLLRVYVNDSVEPAIVVTIYVTSKIGKYWRSR